MSRAVQRGTPAADATLALRALARARGTDVQELQTLYALECLLARVAASPFRDDFVLKGGALLAAYALRRPTKDLDLSATRLANDVDSVTARIRVICEVQLPDGVEFDAGSISATEIRDDDEYSGVRLRISGALGPARVRVGIDVSFGDPIWPAPNIVRVPRLIDTGLDPVLVLGYPLTMVLAEKIVTAVERGEANTRWRDFADVHLVTRRHQIDRGTLRSSVHEVAQYREVEMVPMTEAVGELADLGQARWSRWLRRVDRTDLPENLAEVIGTIARFIDPVLTEADHRASWSPEAQRWVETVDAEAGA
ncbi:nucleotidyl transferase AbiEii/AbiGii toxin family protein [Promicromonospora kroppenstedtii]|uniref:Nucleotidyl transferase AbiEii/AbiGii toxin family protein n=1 Tax=Promicromonospora kroppenstedtii TaxID=440482 RepID=A0ABW7XLS8_9MICO